MPPQWASALCFFSLPIISLASVGLKHRAVTDMESLGPWYSESFRLMQGNMCSGSGQLLTSAFQLPEHDTNAYQWGSGLFCSTSGDFCSAQPLADFYPYAVLESMGGNPAEPVADWVSIAHFQRWGEAGRKCCGWLGIIAVETSYLPVLCTALSPELSLQWVLLQILCPFCLILQGFCWCWVSYATSPAG